MLTSAGPSGRAV